MAKEKTKAQNEEGNTSIVKQEKNFLATFAENFIDPAQLLKQNPLDSFKKEIEITSEYLELEKGESVRAYFVGMASMTGMDGVSKQPVVRLLMEDESYKITASAVIVGSLEPLVEDCPIPVSITNTGETVKGKNGSYTKYVVSILA